jgi:D-sedoheptulose 7-phosphate isomerase
VINNTRKIEKLFKNSISVKEDCIEKGLSSIAIMGELITHSIENEGKIMLCGNGGSAADAQHLAAEMLVRLRPMNNREGVAAIALAQDTSTITACGNDFGFNKLYERMVTSLGKKGDCLIGITTSGNSENIILAMIAAKKMGIKVFGFLGSGGGEALKLCDEVFLVPSNNTGRIQEAHITAGHALMEYIEDKLIESSYLNLQD